jgi:nucleoside-diphosphate kinase
MPVERTFIMIKPGGVQRRLTGEIIRRFESKGLQIVAMKMMMVSRELAEKHYEEHKGKEFFEDLVAYITSSPVVAMVFEGENAVKLSRILMGTTNPLEAGPGTIRGDLASSTRKNLVHGSDSKESAGREINNFFTGEQIVSYLSDLARWTY